MIIELLMLLVPLILLLFVAILWFIMRDNFFEYRKLIYLTSFVSIFTLVVVEYFGISFISHWANSVLLIIVWLIVILSIVVMSIIKNKIIKILFWAIVVCVSPLIILSPVGVIFRLIYNAPEHSEKINQDEICYVYSYRDDATNDGGYLVTRSKQFFIFERKIETIKYSTYKGKGKLTEQNVCSLFKKNEN